MRARGSTTALATIALLLSGSPSSLAGQERVRLGIEVLLSDSMHLVSGKRVGLITNHTGITPDGKSTIDLLYNAKGVRLTALFAPEHGIRGSAAAGQRIEDEVDSKTGVPIFSLYGATRVPTPEMLKDVDVLVFDIQDIGSRTYTYQWSMALASEVATANGRDFIVLDRPNPVRGDIVEGGVLDPAYASFVGQYAVALRSGLTPGELIRFLIGTGKVKATVKVVPMQGWKRSMWWDETGLPWRNPSPNIRSFDAALLYTGTVFFEGTNLSEGRGTPAPFQHIGAGWLKDAGAVARALNDLRMPGVSFDSTLVTIEEGQKWGGQTIPMISVTVTDRKSIRPYQVGLQMLRAIYSRHKGEFQWRVLSIDRLSGSGRVREAVELDKIQAVIEDFDRESGEFQRKTTAYLIYPPR
jgi:uncharacterized protein YbbC (DUF1343 family)